MQDPYVVHADPVGRGTSRLKLGKSPRADRTPTSTTGRAETAAGVRHARGLGEVRRGGAGARGVGRGPPPRRATAASPLACRTDPTPTAWAARPFRLTPPKRPSTPEARGNSYVWVELPGIEPAPKMMLTRGNAGFGHVRRRESTRNDLRIRKGVDGINNTVRLRPTHTAGPSAEVGQRLRRADKRSLLER